VVTTNDNDHNNNNNLINYELRYFFLFTAALTETPWIYPLSPQCSTAAADEAPPDVRDKQREEEEEGWGGDTILEDGSLLLLLFCSLSFPDDACHGMGPVELVDVHI
jgi:hypothetical protein